LPVAKPLIREGSDYNYAYYPVIFTNESQLLRSVKALNKRNIYPRRYFCPSLNKLNYIKKQSAPISENIAKRILCLPLAYDLKEKEIKNIADIINSSIR
jgi:dTDP-4-amino-4,6-dideoxygalactose transaminase